MGHHGMRRRQDPAILPGLWIRLLGIRRGQLVQTLYLYVDNFYVGEKRTAWSLMRTLRFLQSKYPHAKEHEVSVEKRPNVGASVSRRQITDTEMFPNIGQFPRGARAFQ